MAMVVRKFPVVRVVLGQKLGLVLGQKLGLVLGQKLGLVLGQKLGLVLGQKLALMLVRVVLAQTRVPGLLSPLLILSRPSGTCDGCRWVEPVEDQR
jgi:hypothetical protein